jgi:hypothetical protein
MKIFIALSLLFLAAPLLTAEESPFEELDFAIWPEYDHPGVLILLDGTLRQEALPITLEFRIPNEAGAVGATFSEGDEEPFEVAVVERADGKWAVLDIPKGSKILRTGFYYDPFTDSVERNIEYIIMLNQPLEHFHVLIQEPPAVENFRIDDPAAQKTGDPSNGFTNYTLLVNRLAAGEQKRISFSYQNPSFKHTMPTWQPLLILAVVSLIVGVVYAKQNKRYCPKCKTQISGSSQYCSSCGANLS